jgi:valyl-tRNA synthetase
LDLLQRHGSDAVRYWAAAGRPGTDLAFDERQMKVGRRLATKILNASRFVLGLGEPGVVREPLDASMLAGVSTVVTAATEAFQAYDHTAALNATEEFFWSYCDDYIELVKERAYGEGPGAGSARAALRTALDVHLRLFAPILPFVTEEVWSWWRPGSVHRAPWPDPAELRTDAPGSDDPDLLVAVASALSQVRRAKSERRLSMKAPVPRVELRGPASTLARLDLARTDLLAAGHIEQLIELPEPADELIVRCLFD